MKELLENADDFIEAGEDSLKKEKWNVAVANYFRAIANICDFLIYAKLKIIPKNHNERFELLKKQFSILHEKIISLFETYRKSYNLKLTREDALNVQKEAYEFRKRADYQKEA